MTIIKVTLFLNCSEIYFFSLVGSTAKGQQQSGSVWGDLGFPSYLLQPSQFSFSFMSMWSASGLLQSPQVSLASYLSPEFLLFHYLFSLLSNPVS